MDFNSFKNEWLGRKIDYDNVFQNQCVDLILQYVKEGYGIGTGVRGNAINYWTEPSAALLTRFQRVGGNDALQGDIVVFNGLAGNPYGHIGIATGNRDSVNVEVLEQNGQTGNGTGTGGDAIRTRYISLNRVAGILRPITLAVAPPAAVVFPFTIEMINPKQIRINKDTSRWGLTYDNFTAIANNPLYGIGVNTIVTVQAILHHNIGYNYYLPDAAEPSGYNVLDCDELPVVVVEPPKPIALPAAPFSSPSSEQYNTIKDIRGYATSNMAANFIPPHSIVPMGTYFVFKRYAEMINITDVQGQPGWWINPSDNVLDPVVAPAPAIGTVPTPWPSGPRTATVTAPVEVPVKTVTVTPLPYVLPYVLPEWQMTYSRFRDNYGKVTSVDYTFLRDYVITDLEKKKKNVPKKVWNEMAMSGSFFKDGVAYARPRLAAEAGTWHGVPLNNGTIESEDITFATTTTTADRQVTHTINTRDYFVLGVGKFEQFISKVWDRVFPTKK